MAERYTPAQVDDAIAKLNENGYDIHYAPNQIDGTRTPYNPSGSLPTVNSSGNANGSLDDSSGDDSTAILAILKDLINQNNDNLQKVFDFNSQQAEKAFERQKELLDLSKNAQKELRSSQFSDTVQDLKRAGINPAVYFGHNGSPANSGAVSLSGVNSASVGTPNIDTISTLANAYASILSSIASNKNADSAVLRQVISSLGSVFSLGSHVSHVKG